MPFQRLAEETTETQVRTRIAKKLKSMIQARIMELDLIDTGKMYWSIKVNWYNQNDFEVKAVDYFKYWNSDYNIVDGIIESSVFQEYVEYQYGKLLAYQLEQGMGLDVL